MAILFLSHLTFSQKNNKIDIEGEKEIYAQNLYRDAIEKKDSNQLAESYYLFGKIALSKNPVKAAEWFTKSIRILEKKGPSFELGRLYIAFSNIYALQNDLKKREFYIEKGKKIFLECNSERGFKQYRSLFEDIEPHLKIDSVWNSPEYATSIFIVGSNSFQIGDLKKAEKFFTQSYNLSKDLQDEQFITCLSLVGLGEIALKKQDFKLAKKYLISSELIAKDYFSNNQTVQFSFLKYKTEYFKAIQDFKSAYETTIRLHKLQNKYFEKDREGAISRIQTEYEVEKKEELLQNKQIELNLIEKNNKLQKWLILILAVFLIVFSILLFYLKRTLNKNKRVIASNAILLREQNHRVKNNLQLVSSMINLQKEKITSKEVREALEDTQLRIESMAILHRTLYDGHDVGNVNIQEFIEELVEYILSIYNQESIELKLYIEDIQIKTDKAIRIGLIINELCVNACKYAFPDIENPFLSLIIKKIDQTIFIELKENGPGVELDFFNEINFNSFGREFIKTQVLQLKGSIELSSPNTYTIHLPL